ncbi:MAG TPA: hypothetical protein VK900_08445 [Anaerolineales bacterium]|nr:hypothetical protein [Anaerolineales bacterium]
MPTRTPATVSVILTVLLLILLAVVSLLLQMVALNGVSERQGVTAMGISLGCQGVVLILLAVFAARATRFLIASVNWNSILAVATTVLVATVIGGAISFLSTIISIPIAGIR